MYQKVWNHKILKGEVAKIEQIWKKVAPVLNLVCPENILIEVKYFRCETNFLFVPGPEVFKYWNPFKGNLPLFCWPCLD